MKRRGFLQMVIGVLLTPLPALKRQVLVPKKHVFFLNVSNLDPEALQAFKEAWAKEHVGLAEYVQVDGL